ncbi:MAG: ABC transporter ATP-binding protein [Pseudomonadota bacterium]
MTTLSVKDLCVQRGGKRVVSDVSAAFEPGQITAIVGPNGAGKSTLLMACAGMLDAEQGGLELSGRPLAEFTHKQRAQSLGYLPQSGEIAWDVTAEALVSLGRMPHGDAASAKGKQAIENALCALECKGLANRRANELSGGERARVLLARVLAGDPRYILADEPLAALDIAHQLSLIAHFKQCAAQGVGVVIVLHDLAMAMNHADTALVLDKGSLVAIGPPEEALSPTVISKVWGVSAHWTGDKGAKALIFDS